MFGGASSTEVVNTTPTDEDVCSQSREETANIDGSIVMRKAASSS